MKRAIFTFLFLLSAVIQSDARFPNRESKSSILKVRLNDDSPITIVIDNRRYDKHGTSITVNDLPAGRHYLKVYSYEDNNRTNRIKARLLFQGNIRIERNTIMTCIVDPRRGTAASKSRSMNNDYEYNDDRYTDDKHNRKYRDDVYNGAAISDHDMNDLKTRVNDRITDTDKMKLMQSVLESRNYTTEQVKLMLAWLSFESSRLDFAKWAYGNVIDKKNYWKLDSEFTFSSSKDEFNEYIKNYK